MKYFKIVLETEDDLEVEMTPKFTNDLKQILHDTGELIVKCEANWESFSIDIDAINFEIDGRKFGYNEDEMYIEKNGTLYCIDFTDEMKDIFDDYFDEYKNESFENQYCDWDGEVLPTYKAQWR